MACQFVASSRYCSASIVRLMDWTFILTPCDLRSVHHIVIGHVVGLSPDKHLLNLVPVNEPAPGVPRDRQLRVIHPGLTLTLRDILPGSEVESLTRPRSEERRVGQGGRAT